MSKKNKKIWFIVLVSVFGVLWLYSLVMLSLAAFNDSVTLSIESWYLENHPEDLATGQEAKTLDLLNVSTWMFAINTAALLIVLLFKELKKKYITK